MLGWIASKAPVLSGPELGGPTPRWQATRNTGDPYQGRWIPPLQGEPDLRWSEAQGGRPLVQGTRTQPSWRPGAGRTYERSAWASPWQEIPQPSPPGDGSGNSSGRVKALRLEQELWITVNLAHKLRMQEEPAYRDHRALLGQRMEIQVACHCSHADKMVETPLRCQMVGLNPD